MYSLHAATVYLFFNVRYSMRLLEMAANALIMLLKKIIARISRNHL